MTTYEEIIYALLRGEAGKYIPEGCAYSFPLPRQDDAGELIDSFFLYSVVFSTRTPTTPHGYVGIHGADGTMAYHRSHEEDALPWDMPPAPTTLTFAEMSELAEDYEMLYPQIRSFAFSDTLTDLQPLLLENFFHIQRRLFGSQLSCYRQTSPEFYRWMLDKLGERITFLQLLKKRRVQPADARLYSQMAASEAERQRILGMNEAEIAFWEAHGDSSLRKILCSQTHHLNLRVFAQPESEVYIAARSYSPLSTVKRQYHAQRLEEVRQLARDIRQEFDLSLPADPEALAERLGVHVEHTNLAQDIDGYVQLDCDSPIITINDSAKRGYDRRQRFTLAHEIGHVVIPWHTGTTRCNTDDLTVTIKEKRLVDSQEQEANVFASELLIPSDWLRERWEAAESLESLLETVLNETGVSTLAALYAMEYILPPGEVLCVTSQDMHGWKIFRGPEVPAWRNQKSALAGLKKAFIQTEELTLRSYTICHYRKKH